MGTKANLVNTFNAMVAAFNAFNADPPTGTLPAFAQYLDEQVIFYSNSGHLGYYPKHVAEAYLTSQSADHPSFTQPLPSSIVLNQTGTGAFITGYAIWTDSNNLNGEHLLFDFTFIYKNGNWLLLTAWASAP